MSLTLEQVRHVAQLARLALTEEEERLYQAQLSKILEAVALLSTVDTQAVEPTSHVSFAESPLREDVVQPALGVDKALANAPAKVGTSFSVPKVIE